MTTIAISPRDDLDTLLAAAPPQADIFLEPGQHYTRGRLERDGTTPLVKSGQRITGLSGQTKILLRPTQLQPAGTVVPLRGVFLSLYQERVDGVQIRGIHFDLGADEMGAEAVSAVALRGSDNRILDCSASNWGNRSPSNIESFVFSLAAPWGPGRMTYGRNNWIEGCTATDPLPNTAGARTTVFAVGGGTLGDGRRAVACNGGIRGCTVVSDTPTSLVHAFHACGDNVVVEACAAERCWAGFYHDTWRNEFLVIRSCSFHGCLNGVRFNLGGVTHGEAATVGRLIVHGNSIVLPTLTDQRGICTWMQAECPRLVDSFRCYDNAVWNMPAVPIPPALKSLGIYGYRCGRFVVHNNLVDLIPGGVWREVMANQCATVIATDNTPPLFNFSANMAVG